MAVKKLSVRMDDLMDGTMGICLACGEEAYGVEPDARNYECESCGKSEVFGLEEAVLGGDVELEVGDGDDF